MVATEGLGAPSYCSNSPTPRIRKNRGRDVPEDHVRFGIDSISYSKEVSPFTCNRSSVTTDTLIGASSFLEAKGTPRIISSVTDLFSSFSWAANSYGHKKKCANMTVTTKISAAGSRRIGRGFKVFLCDIFLSLRRHYPIQVRRVSLIIKATLRCYTHLPRVGSAVVP